MKNIYYVLLGASIAFASCSKNKLEYFSGHDIFIDGNDVYIAGSGCEGSSLTDRPMLWCNGEPQTVGEIGNFNKATSVCVSDGEVYVTMSTEKGASLWKNGVVELLSGDDTYGQANSVYVNDGTVYVGGQANSCPVIWIDGVENVLGYQGCINKVTVHNGDVYAVGYTGEPFGGNPCLWINRTRHELSQYPGEANDIAFNGDDVYVAGKCQGGAALWQNDLLVMCELERSCAYAVAVNGDDVYLGGNGFDVTLRPVAFLWKNGESRQIPEMHDEIYSLQVHANKLYIAGSSKSSIPIKVIDL